MRNRVNHIVLWVFIAIILILVFFSFLLPGAEVGQSKNSIPHSLSAVVRHITLIAIIPWLAIFLYKDRLRKRLVTVEQARRMKVVVASTWWLLVGILGLVTVRFIITVYTGSGDILSIARSATFVLLFGYLAAGQWVEFQYCRKHPLNVIAAAGLIEQHSRSLGARDVDTAYTSLVRACEIAPSETELWCRLALFSQQVRKDPTEADKHLTRARELTTTSKAGCKSDYASYLNCLGLILYERGEYDKGLEHLKQSIDIDPRPGRITWYQKKLSEWKNKEQDESSNRG